MATVIWRGGAPTQAHIVGWTFGGTWETDDRILLTIGSKTVSVAAGSTTLTTVVDNVVTTWNNLSATLYPEYAELTASRSSNDFRLTSDVAGREIGPISITTTEANGSAADSQTIGSQTTVTANAGPNDWSSAMNWSTGTVPVASDDVVIENSDDEIIYGLNQSTIVLGSLTIKASFLGTIGLPLVNATSGYYEYRQKELKIVPAVLNIGQGEGTGSSFINIDCAAAALTTTNVYATGTSGDASRAPVRLISGNVANVINVMQGQVDVGYQAGDTSGFDALNVASEDGSTVVRVGTSATTLTTANIRSGTVEINGTTVTTLTMTDGDLTILGTAAVTTLNIDGGTCHASSTGTITTANVSAGGILDFSQDLRARTVTNMNLFAGGELRDPNRSITFTNGVELERCGISEVQIDVGTHVKLTLGTPS